MKTVHTLVRFFIFVPILVIFSLVIVSVAYKGDSLSLDQNNLLTKATISSADIYPESIKQNPSPKNLQILGVQDSATKSSNTKSLQNQKKSFEIQTLYNLINSYRSENDLNELFVSPLLEDSSNRKILDMIATEYFDHEDKNQNESWYLFQAAGYQFKSAGENLSVGNNTPWQVFQAWQKSPIHNEQLLKPEYLDLGISVDCNEYKIGRTPSCLVVLHLGAR